MRRIYRDLLAEIELIVIGACSPETKKKSNFHVAPTEVKIPSKHWLQSSRAIFIWVQSEI